ncbi:MAG TPA: non-reducing end alpha-L-arabinofuranosidase family hydrolase [Candidatus Paceibacterota bacterium]|nr:non-reducing end alpha-L-arabinofuranosidase family hydrolase [Verrucomicrobiota bacterium]HRZ44481.1 non-reducing end alpha-L-arabinofuranosidase family hydrolase [Candidatus Paceibacterota bacterium]
MPWLAPLMAVSGIALAAGSGASGVAASEPATRQPSPAWTDGRFAWKSSGPIVDVGPDRSAPDPHIAIKDPTVVFADGRWHVFATVRMKSGRVDIEYLNFVSWAEANQAPRHVLALHSQYYCAPQVFFFSPHRRWYLIYQLADSSRQPPFGPCFSTTRRLADPKSWTPPQPMVTNAPAKPKWLDFWVIADTEKAHLFYTSLDGHLWRRETRLADFPLGWSSQQLALRADLFEASHTYRLQGLNRYLTIVEAQGKARRYYKAYLADRLEGPWRPLADSIEHSFAAPANVQLDVPWTDNFSHGELIRAGIDERMEINPGRIRFLYQGASDEEYRSTGYGGIPWRLGMLESQR